MKAAKKDIYTLTQDYHASTNGKLEFISGKWFYDKKEIKNIQRYLYRTGMFSDVTQLDKFIDSYKVLYESSGNWYPLPIIEEAQGVKELAPLCYPLNTKQLKIINALLKHDEEVMFILTGVGGSGKSTFANIICKIFDDDTAALSLADLGDDFKVATGINKRLIYSTELNSEELNNASIKQLISNEEITVNPKHDRPYKARCQSAFFFNCNKVPRFDIGDSGLMRRVVYYPMNEKIKNPDTTLNKKQWEHDDLVNIVAHALRVDMKDWRKDFEKDTRNYVLKDNSVYRFSHFDIYEEYANACKIQGLKPYSQPRWEEIREVIKEWGMLDGLTPVTKKEQMEIDEIFR